jgi:predicted GIY-YIG superfamily endonuclease
MPFVYVLKSVRNGKRYVGFTTKTPVEKLAEHNSGATHWTRRNGPFVVLYTEEFGDPTVARRREQFLKIREGSRVVRS